MSTPGRKQVTSSSVLWHLSGWVLFLFVVVVVQVVSLSVKEGDHVEEGQPLAIVEAMKMQNVLRAENSALVSSVRCKPGDTLRVDAVMMEFEFGDE